MTSISRLICLAQPDFLEGVANEHVAPGYYAHYFTVKALLFRATCDRKHKGTKALEDTVSHLAEAQECREETDQIHRLRNVWSTRVYWSPTHLCNASAVYQYYVGSSFGYRLLSQFRDLRSERGHSINLVG